MTAPRSQYAWPFAWNACWNIPISASAAYAATGIVSTDDYSTEKYAVENNSVSTSFPLKSFNDSDQGTKTVYCDPGMTGTGAWNDTCAFLDENGDTVWQGQTLELSAGGNPSIGGSGDYVVGGVSITTGTGNPGAHGGSSLSCLGGTITEAEMLAKYIPHAMKVGFNGLMYYSSAGSGWQWPAANADGEYNVPGTGNYYGGSNSHIVEGALLALPPGINVSTRYSDPLVIAIATAMQNYGCYICDNTASGEGNSTSFIEMNYNAAPYFNGTSTFNSDLLRMYGDLEVVTNSTQSTPGGGAYGTQRRAAWAPPFTAQPAMATLTDNFASNDLSTLWGSSGTVTWSAGQVAIPHGSYLGATSTYDLTSSSFAVKVSPYVASGAATNIQLQLSTGDNLLFGYDGGELAVYSTIGGTKTTLFTTTYNATAHAWWRVSESGGTVSFATAPDGDTWTTQYSAADYAFGFPLTQLNASVQRGSETTGTSYVYAVSPSGSAGGGGGTVTTLDYAPVASTQATASGGVASSATAFSPAAGSEVVVLVQYQFASSGESATLTCKDSNGVSYTAGPQIENSFDSYISAIFTCQYESAPGSVTVDITSSNTTTAYALITPLVFSGQAASQEGAATATADPAGSTEAISVSIDTTAEGSFVVTVAGASNGVTLTPLANMTTLAAWTAADCAGTGVTSAATVTPGATTVGWTCSAASEYGNAIAALEILPASGGTGTGGGTGAIIPNGIPGSWTNIFNETFPGTELNTGNWTVTEGTDWSDSGAESSASNIAMLGPGMGMTLAAADSGVQIQTSYFLNVGDCCEAKIWFPGPDSPGNVIYNWPAWWAAGQDWPDNGEIDIAEGLGDGETGALTINYHDSSGNYNGPEPGPAGNWSGSWHTYGVIRNASTFDAYYDGVMVYSHATADEGGPMALLLDVSSGDDGGPALYGSGSQVQVQYVRAWTPGAAVSPPAGLVIASVI